MYGTYYKRIAKIELAAIALSYLQHSVAVVYSVSAIPEGNCRKPLPNIIIMQ
jgi:hypothetical protein